MARGWHYTKLSLSSALLLSFSGMCIFIIVTFFCRFCFVSLCFFCVLFLILLSLELCRCSSDIFLSPAHHVPDCQPHILLGTVEARSVNVKKTTTATTTWIMSKLTRDGTAEPVSRDQSLRRVRGQGNIHFPCSANHKQDRQPHPVDSYSAICDDHTYTQQSKDGPGMVVNPALGEMTKEINVFPVHVGD